MAKETKGELVLAQERFDYSPLEKKVADEVQSTADRIRQSIKRTTESIIAIGNDLMTVKEALPHGQFGPWLRAEFTWTERTAQKFMAVAERFRPISELSSVFDPTAAYLLAAPSAPDEARQAAVERAEAGEHITAKVAKEILAEERKKPLRKRRRGPEAVREKLANFLARLRKGWNKKELSELAQQLREFAATLEEGLSPKRKKARAST